MAIIYIEYTDQYFLHFNLDTLKLNHTQLFILIFHLLKRDP